MIEGSLRDVPVMDVFQVVITGQKTGVLVVEGQARARVFFERGRLQSAHMVPGVHLGEIMVRMDLLSAHEVQALLAEQQAENAGTPLGLAALEKGFIEREDLRRALEAQALEIISELMLFRGGQFSFSERPVTSSQVPTDESLDAMTLLMEAVRRLDAWRQGAVKPFEVFDKAAVDPTKVELPRGGWEVLGCLDGRRSARAVAAELDMGEKQVYRVLYELKERGVVRPAPFQVEDPTVLVVCPSNALQGLIRLSLQRASLRPEVVTGYAEGLDCLAERHPQAVVVDDDGGAWDFVRELRKRPGQSHLPALVLSAEAPGGFLSRLRRPKAAVLAKPFHELELQEVVSGLLGRTLT